MSESNRRCVCRILFVFLAIAPCCAVLALAAWRSSAWDDAPFKSALRETLGVEAEWDRLSYPAPGEMRCEGLRLYDAQTTTLLAEVDQIIVVDHGDKRVFSFGAVRVQAEQVACLSEAVQALLASEAHLGATIEPFELKIVDAKQQALATATIDRANAWESDGRRNASVAFRIGANSRDAEIKLNVQRDVLNNSFRVLLDTQGHPLPLAMASAIWPELQALGKRACFQGTLDLTRNVNGWYAQVRGNVERIDLKTLVNDHTTQQLTGEGALRIDEARFANGRLVAATGKFGATDGEIGLGLLSDASAYFAFQSVLPKEQLQAERQSTVPYSKILVGFGVQNGTCELEGGCQPGYIAVLDDQADPLLRTASKVGRQPTSVAVRMFFATDEPHLPAATESLWLASWLPMPKAGDLAPPNTQTPNANALRSRAPRQK